MQVSSNELGQNAMAIAGLLWRRKLWVLAPLILAMSGALGVIKLMTPQYMASTMIMVEQQKIPADYVRPTVTASMQERLRTIEQQIVNRENLERIVREMDLYPELRARLPMDQVVQKARRALELQVMGDSVFRIYFSGTDPVRVADTANWIADFFIQQNLTLRGQQARGTTDFLDAELERTRSALEQQEQLVANFRIQHEGELPEQRVAIVQALDQLDSRLRIILDSIDKAELRKLLTGRESAAQALSCAAAVPRLDANSMTLRR